MTADFNEAYWLIERGFQIICINNKSYYHVVAPGNKLIYVRKLDPTDKRSFFKDQYVCHINISSGKGDIVFSDYIDFNSSQWISATGITPKYAINDAITKALSCPAMQNKGELRAFGLSLNPIIQFLKNCINLFTNR